MKFDFSNKLVTIDRLRKLTHSLKTNERGQITVEASLIVTFIVLVIVLSLSFMGMTYQEGKLVLIAHEALYEGQDKKITLETDWQHLASEDQTLLKASREQHRPNFRLKLFEFRSVEQIVEDLDDE